MKDLEGTNIRKVKVKILEIVKFCRVSLDASLCTLDADPFETSGKVWLSDCALQISSGYKQKLITHTGRVRQK